ncbi:50S ribosomal protein L25 [Patescibacteria group bacterium]
MKQLLIEATKRDITKEKNSALRSRNMIPAVVYGHDRESTAISVSYIPFEKVQKDVKGNLIDLKIDSEQPVKVLIQEVQTDPVNGKFKHVDFHQVNLMEKLTTDISLNFIGESKAVKELGGVLIKSHTSLRVECLAKDLVDSIEVDITKLKTFDDMVRIQDLSIPQGLEVKQKLDDVVALVQPPRTEEELKALEDKVEGEVEKVEVAEKGKIEEAEDEEGAGEDEKEPKEDPSASSGRGKKEESKKE